MSYADIIARLEGLRGPDREVDIAICLRLNYVGAHQNGTIENLRRADPEDDYLDYECYDDGGSIPECTDQAPKLTASLDASIALVEKMLPGWGYTAGKNHEGMAMAGLRRPTARGPMPERGCDRQDGSLPIALLTALFRSLQEKQDG